MTDQMRNKGVEFGCVCVWENVFTDSVEKVPFISHQRPKLN